MSTASLTTTPTTLDSGLSGGISIRNTGTTRVTVVNGPARDTIRAGRQYNAAVQGAVTAYVTASDGSSGTITYDVSAVNTGANLVQVNELAPSASTLLATPAASPTLTGTLTTWTVTAVDCTAGAGARSLPAASSVAAGTQCIAKKTDTTANTLTVSRAGSDLIFGTGAGATTKTITLPGEAVTFVSDGTARWTVVASDTPSGVLATTYAGLVGEKFRNAAARAARRNSVDLGPMRTPPALSTGTSGLDASLSQFVQANASAATLARFRFVGGLPLNTATVYRACYVLTRPGGSAGNFPFDGTKDQLGWAVEFMTDSPKLQIQQLNGSSPYMIEVDDQPVQGGPLSMPGGGGTAYTLIKFSLGSATITASTGVLTLASTPEKPLQVGDEVMLGTITTTTGISADRNYFVRTAPTATTFALSLTPGGSALSLTGDGSTTEVLVAAQRKIRVEYSSGQAFSAVDLPPRYSVWAPTYDAQVRVCTVGDSVDANSTVIVPNGGWQHTAGKLLGWTDVRQVSYGGTGFINDASGTLNTFGSAQRIADVVAHNPDLLVVTISQNDEGYVSATTQAAILAALQAYRTALPTVPIVVQGASASSSGPSAGRIALENTGKAAFDQWADARSWWIPVTTDPAGSWETGTGTAASRANNGNRDRYGYDSAHPNQPGHNYIGRRFANAFRTTVLPTL